METEKKKDYIVSSDGQEISLPEGCFRPKAAAPRPQEEAKPKKKRNPRAKNPIIGLSGLGEYLTPEQLDTNAATDEFLRMTGFPEPTVLPPATAVPGPTPAPPWWATFVGIGLSGLIGSLFVGKK